MATVLRRNRKIQIFESSIEKLGRILSQKWKIKVIFKHGECSTEGNTIYLPTVPDNASQDLLDAMQGHLDHETAHIVFTDFEQFQKLRRREKKLFTAANGLEDPRVERRFSELWRGAAVNLRRSREWSLKKMKEPRQMTHPVTGKMTNARPWDGLSDFGKIIYASTIYTGVGFDDQHWFLQEVVEQLVLDKVITVREYLSRARNAETTAEVIAISREFLKALSEEEEPDNTIDPEDIPDNAKFLPPGAISPQDQTMFKKPEPIPGAPPIIQTEFLDEEEEKDENLVKKALPIPVQSKKANNEPDDAQNDPQQTKQQSKPGPGPSKEPTKSTSTPQQGPTVPSAPGDAEEEDDKAPGAASNQSKASPDPKRQGNAGLGKPTPKNKGGAPGGAGKEEPLDLEPSADDLERDEGLTQLSGMIRRAAASELKGTDSYLVYTTEGDKLELIKDGDRAKYKAFMAEATKMVAVMKRRLQRAMLSSKASRWEGDKTRGKVNPRAAFRVLLGTSKRVFRQLVESEDFDTTVLMMVDHSGSMGKKALWFGRDDDDDGADLKLNLAAKTAIVIGEVCHQLGIPFSVVGVSTGESDEAQERFDHASEAERQLYSRWGNMWIGMYKDFDELWTSTSHKLINMLRNERVNTYDGEYLRYGAQRLLARKEKRKILIYLNDGEPFPNVCDDHEAHTEYTKRCAEEVEKHVELLVFGIKTDAVKRFYSNYVVVNNLSDLPAAALTQFDLLLRKGKRLVPKSARKS